MAIRVLICDDHQLMQRGIRTLLETVPDIEVVGAASTAEEAVVLARELRPDVVLMDISMPGGGGIDATRQISQSMPDVRVLILTGHEEEMILQEALKAGAAGYIVKRAAETELIDAARAVARGDLYLHPAITRSYLRTLQTSPEPETFDAELLTPRETDVLRLLARGFTNPQIAEKLVLSVRTVESHRANITSKLGLRTRVDLANYAEKHHLLE